MIVPPNIVATFFVAVAIFSLVDIMKVTEKSRKWFRFFQSIIMTIAAVYYFQASFMDAVPASDLRVVWICLCIVNIAEIISRWEFRRFGKKQ